MGIFRGEEVPDLAIFWEGSGTPRDEPGGTLKHGGDRGFFQNFHDGEWGGEEGSCLGSRSCIA